MSLFRSAFSLTPVTALADKSSPSTIENWAQLVRLPNVFTVLADVSAAFLLVAHGPEPASRFVCVIAAGVALYWAGMILNDVFDVDRDKIERPVRPIASGEISLAKAKVAGWGLLVVGVGLGAASGYLPAAELPTTWLPAAIAGLLAVTIVAYDGPLKQTPAAPAAMGACRMLSFLLGAAPCLNVEVDGPIVPKYLFGVALGFGTYVMGLTTIARREARGGPSTNLPTGLVVTVLGAAMIALAPQLARGAVAWHASPTGTFPWMIGMIAFPVVVRGIRAVRDPTPDKIQMTIRVGILTIIPLAAAYAFLGAGPRFGLAIFALVVPSLWLSAHFRVT